VRVLERRGVLQRCRFENSVHEDTDITNFRQNIHAKHTHHWLVRPRLLHRTEM